jgi:hypothetical protein
MKKSFKKTLPVSTNKLINSHESEIESSELRLQMINEQLLWKPSKRQRLESKLKSVSIKNHQSFKNSMNLILDYFLHSPQISKSEETKTRQDHSIDQTFF